MWRSTSLVKPSLFSGGSEILVEFPQLRKPALWVAIGLSASSVLLAILFLSVYLVSDLVPGIRAGEHPA